MSRALASLAARIVGRRVQLRTGQVGTVTRVTGRGITVAIPDLTHTDIRRYLDD